MNKYTRSQFLYSTYGKPVMIAGGISLVQPVKATLVNQGVTLTAVAFGTSGNNITYALTAGGTAGAEVVTVVGNAISVQIQSGVSSITQVRTAINASVAAAALVVATGTSASAVTAPVAATHLAGGIDTVVSNNLGSLVRSVARTGVGEYTITFSDTYNSLQSIGLQLMAATPVDLVPQATGLVTGNGGVVFSLLAGATPTELAAPATLYVNVILNASSI